QRLMAAHPLLHAAVAHVAHYQIRNRGTVGGSLAHADPAAELPGVAVTCEGEITLCGPAGSRTVRAGDFFTGPLSTLRRPDEIVTELHRPGASPAPVTSAAAAWACRPKKPPNPNYIHLKRPRSDLKTRAPAF